ncbi:MAG TPA: OmpA family protein [Gammaproteobacteria bacterium]|nr:OmpA family protein [Gammaproteobacteria bacterium]
MKIKSTLATFSVAAAVAMALAPAAPAYSSCSNVIDSAGKNVRDSSKSCVKTSTWHKADWTEACGKPAAPKPKPKPKPIVTEVAPPAAAPPPPPEPVVVPEPAPVEPVVQHMTLDGEALFATNSASLTSTGKAAVDNVVEQLRGFDKVRTITITGHTDSRGSAAYNQKLSERRANAVRDYLISQGVNPALLSAVGMGEEAPVADNNTEEGRQQNRRVDIDVDGSKLVTQ